MCTNEKAQHKSASAHTQYCCKKEADYVGNFKHFLQQWATLQVHNN